MTSNLHDSYLRRLGKIGHLLTAAGQAGSGSHRSGLVIFAADHGISTEGYSAYAPLRTDTLVEYHLQGKSPVSRILKHINRPEIIVDVGLAHPLHHQALLQHRVRQGSRSFLEQDALQSGEVQQAIQKGFSLWDEISGWQFDIIGLGELGVGNTLVAEAITCTMLKLEPEKVAASGSADDKVIRHKTDIIKRALQYRHPQPDNHVDLLMRFGGLEIAALTGFIIRMFTLNKVVILDGLVTAVAAALASMALPGKTELLVAPSLAAEMGHRYVLEELGLKAVWDWQLNYGEGLAAALSIFLLEVLI